MSDNIRYEDSQLYRIRHSAAHVMAGRAGVLPRCEIHDRPAC